MRASLLGIALYVCFSWFGVAKAEPFPVPNAANQYIYDQINSFRADNGKGPLRARWAPNLIADEYAIWLAANGKSGHYDDGLGPEGRMKAAQAREPKYRKPGYDYCRIWENIHESWSEPSAETWRQAADSAMTFWKNSPGHRANMLSDSQYMGIGIRGWRDGNKWTYKEVVVFTDRSCLPSK